MLRLALRESSVHRGFATLAPTWTMRRLPIERSDFNYSRRLARRTNINNITTTTTTSTSIQAYPHSTRCLCTTSELAGPGPPKHPIEVLPLPEGVSGDEFQLLEVLDTAPRDVDGFNTVIAVHGPASAMTNQSEVMYGANGGCFAVIEAGGTQHKVCADNAFYLNRIPGEVNTEVVFDKVLLLGSVRWTMFGRPYIPFAKVTATIEEQTLSGKVMVTKFKKRKGYTRRQGHRQRVTRVRINQVQFVMPKKDVIIPHQIELDPLRPNLPSNPTYT